MRSVRKDCMRIWESADVGVFFDAIDDAKPQQQQQIVCGHRFLQEREPCFSEPGSDLEYGMVCQRDDMASAVAEICKGDEVHRFVFEQSHIDDEVARRIGSTDLTCLGEGRTASDAY